MEYLAIAKFYKEQNTIFKAKNVKKEKKVKIPPPPPPKQTKTNIPPPPPKPPIQNDKKDK